MGWLRVTTACLLFSLLVAEVAAGPDTTVVSTVPVYSQIPSDQGRKDFGVLITVKATGDATSSLTDIILVKSVSSNVLATPVEKAEKNIKLLFTEKFKFTDLPDDLASTSLKDKLQEAITKLEDMNTGHPGAIIVLSDYNGMDVGDNDFTSVKSINKYPVHTFGLGDNHDPEKLHQIASNSNGGTFSFVDNNNLNLNGLSAAVAVCLAGLENVVVPATGVLRLQLTDARVKVKEKKDWPITNQDSKAGTVDIKIGMLNKGQTKKIVVKLEVDPYTSSSTDQMCVNQQTLFTARVWTSGDTSGQAISTEKVLCVGRPPVVPAVSVATSHLVLKQIIWSALIKEIVGISVTSAATWKKEVNSAWASFVEGHQYWSHIDVLLEDLEQEFLDLKMQVDAYLGDGLQTTTWKAYIYSWISSHVTQRPTVMGSWLKVVRVFTTREIHEVITRTIIEKGQPCVEPTCYSVTELTEVIKQAISGKGMSTTACFKDPSSSWTSNILITENQKIDKS